MALDTDDSRARLMSPSLSRRDRMRRVWRYSGALFVSALLANAVFGEQGVIETLRLQREHRQMSHDLQRLRRDNQRLLQSLARHDDPAYIEELSRRSLGLIKPGEVVVILKDAPVPPDADGSR